MARLPESPQGRDIRLGHERRTETREARQRRETDAGGYVSAAPRWTVRPLDPTRFGGLRAEARPW